MWNYRTSQAKTMIVIGDSIINISDLVMADVEGPHVILSFSSLKENQEIYCGSKEASIEFMKKLWDHFQKAEKVDYPYRRGKQ